MTAGNFSFPTTQIAFDLPVSEPIGPTLVVDIVTKEPINFYAQSLDDRNPDGSIDVDLATMSHSATRAI